MHNSRLSRLAACFALAAGATASVPQQAPDPIVLTNGTIIDGTETLEEVGERIFRHMLAVASGERTKSEELGFGDAEFVPWQIGAQM